MADSSIINIKVLFDGAAQGAMSATRRLSSEVKQLGQDAKRTGDWLRSMGRGVGRGLEAGAMFGAGAKMGYDMFLAPMARAAETYEEAITRARIAFMDAQGRTSQNFEQIAALSEKLSVDYAGSAKNFLEVATTLRQGQVKEEVILKAGLKAVADLATIKQARSDEDFTRIAGQVNVFLDAFRLPEEKVDSFVDNLQKAKYAFELETEDLAESLKYSMSAVQNLGLTGEDGARNVMTMFGVLKQAGQAGSIAGSNFDEFAKRLPRAGEEIKKMRKKGVVGKDFDMTFFDQKGRFLGLENALKELDKLKMLSEEKRLVAMSELFGETGARYVSAMLSKGGVEAYREYGRRYGERASKEVVIGMLQGTASLKKESMMGALENAAAKAGESLNEFLKKIYDFVGNDVAGWMSANPNATLGGGAVATLLSGVASMKAFEGVKNWLRGGAAGGGAAAQGEMRSLLVDQFGRSLSSGGAAGGGAGSWLGRAGSWLGRAGGLLGRVSPYLSVALGLKELAMREGVTAEDVKNMQVRAASEAGGRFRDVPLRGVEIYYQPTVTIQGASETERERFLKLLQDHKEQVAKAVDQVQQRKQTISFAR